VTSELHKQVTFVVVITVVSLLFPESSERDPKVTFFGNARSSMSEVTRY